MIINFIRHGMTEGNKSKKYIGITDEVLCDEGIHELKKDAMGNCLSTSKKTNGAVAVFLPGVAERLAALLESDFYMVFTSIHEVMIHNDRNVEPEDLKEVLQETIKSATPKEDYLTSRIYHYSRATHKFTCVSED